MKRKYPIQWPFSNYVLIVINLLIIGIFSLMLIRTDKIELIIMDFVVIVVYLFQTIVVGINLMKRNRYIEILESELIIGNKSIKYDEIQEIIISGYFMKSIGVKLKRQKFVSIDFHFKFLMNEEENMSELLNWAESHAIKVRKGRILRLI